MALLQILLKLLRPFSYRMGYSGAYNIYCSSCGHGGSSHGSSRNHEHAATTAAAATSAVTAVTSPRQPVRCRKSQSLASPTPGHSVYFPSRIMISVFECVRPGHGVWLTFSDETIHSTCMVATMVFGGCQGGGYVGGMGSGSYTGCGYVGGSYGGKGGYGAMGTERQPLQIITGKFL